MTAQRLAAAFVEARSRATLLLFPVFGAKSFQSKSFRLPAAAESLSFCVLKEKVTKEKEHPASALSGHPARKVRVRATGFFDSTSCAGEKLAGIPAGHPAGFPSPARRCRGAPGRAAGHPGPHSSEEPNQQPNQLPNQLQCSSSASLCFAALAHQLYHRVRATMARCSTRGPCAAVSRGRQAAQRASAWMPMPFRQHMDVLSKSPAPTHGLAGQEPGKRQAGWPSLLVTFLLATQEKSDSVAKGDRPLFALNASCTTFASPVASRVAGALA